MKAHRIYYAILAVGVAFGSAFANAQTTLTFTQLDVPGSVSTEADGINAQGEIIGFFVDSAGKQHGFLHQDATFTQLDFPGATATHRRHQQRRRDCWIIY
jgi:probable HAF family extracellular repeat protein